MINNILISRKTREILHKDNYNIGLEGENLQETLVFNLDEELEGQGIIEIKFPDELTGFIEIEKTELGYELPLKSSLLKQSGQIEMQLTIMQNKQEVFKSEPTKFRIKKSINATETIPEQYPTWIENLETLKLNLEKSEEERVTSERARVEAEEQREETFSQMEKSIEEAVKEIADKKADYDKNAIEKTNEYNKLAEQRTNSFNSNAETKTNSFNANASEKTTVFDTDVATKTNEFNTNATNKTTEFNNNAKDKTDTFNSNAETKTNAYNENAETKTDEYNTNAESKINEYNENAEELKNRITTLENENTELQLECERLRVDNEAISIIGQATGENITLEDASDARFKKFEIGGNSKQETREGYNLFNEKYEIGYFTGDSGSSNTATTGGKATDYIDVGDNTTLYILFNCLKECKLGRFWFMEFDENFNGISRKLAYVYDTNFSVGNIIKAITLSEGTKYIKPSFYNLVTDDDISSYDNFRNYFNICISTKEVSEYEPYGAMPSLEFKSPVKGAGEIVNEFDENKIEKNRYLLPNGNTGTTKYSNITGYMKVQANIPYKFSYDYDELSKNENRVYVLYDMAKQVILGDGYIHSDKSLSIVSPQDGYIRISYDINCKNIKFEAEKNNIEIKVVNKNLADISKVPKQTKIISCKENTIYIKNESYGNIDRVIIMDYLNLDYDTYTISVSEVKGTINALDLEFLNKAYTTVKKANLLDFQKGGKVTANIDRVRFSRISNGSDFSFKLQIERASSKSDYVDNELQKYVVPIQKPFYEVGDEKDKFAKVDGIWYEQHETKKYVFTGEEEIIIQDETEGICKIQCLTGIKRIAYNLGLSNIGTIKENNTDFNNSDNSIVLTDNESSGVYEWFWIHSSSLINKTVEEVQQALKDNYVIYPLEIPELIPCTEEQSAILDEIEKKLHSAKEKTYIYSEDEISPIFDIEYLKDPEVTNNELQTQIDEIKQLLSTTTTSAMLLDNMQTDLESEV